MQEDKLETLEKLFPNGFIVLHVESDTHLRMAASNKKGSALIAYFMQFIVQIFQQLNQLANEEGNNNDALSN
jgi:hypothetical protein